MKNIDNVDMKIGYCVPAGPCPPVDTLKGTLKTLK